MSIDRGLLDQQLGALGQDGTWWNHRELRDLPTVLREDERVLAIARGKLHRGRWLTRSWLIVLTGERLFGIRSYRRGGWRQIEVSVRGITRVSLRIGPFRGRVIVDTVGERVRVIVPRPQAYALVSALSKLAPRRSEAPGRPPVSAFVRRLLDHVLEFPAAAFRPDPQPGSLPPLPEPRVSDQRVEALEEQLLEVQRQVEFLEELLRERHAAPARVGESFAP